MDKNTEVTVKLNTPIKSGDKSISEITLREPKAGELRGFNLLDVLQLNVVAHMILLPRISTPHLTEAQISTMSGSDVIKLMSGVVNFFGD